jgi:excisionase family DNA binding protein
MPMTKKEAADFLGVTVRAIEGYAAKGRLHPTYATGQRGKVAMFDDAELARLKEERGQVVFTQPPSPEQPTQASPENTNTALVAPSDNERFLALLEAITARPESTAPASIGEKILLTLSDASALTSLSANHLRDALHTGKLKGKIIGRGWKIKRADLDLYVKKL